MTTNSIISFEEKNLVELISNCENTDSCFSNKNKLKCNTNNYQIDTEKGYNGFSGAGGFNIVFYAKNTNTKEKFAFRFFNKLFTEQEIQLLGFTKQSRPKIIFLSPSPSHAAPKANNLPLRSKSARSFA